MFSNISTTIFTCNGEALLECYYRYAVIARLVSAVAIQIDNILLPSAGNQAGSGH